MINNKHFNLQTKEEFDFYNENLGFQCAILGYVLGCAEPNKGIISFNMYGFCEEIKIDYWRVFKAIDLLQNYDFFSCYVKQGSGMTIYLNNGALLKNNNGFSFNFRSKRNLGFKNYVKSLGFQIALLSHIVGLMNKESNIACVKQKELAVNINRNNGLISRNLKKLENVGFISIDRKNFEIAVDKEFTKITAPFFNNI